MLTPIVPSWIPHQGMVAPLRKEALADQTSSSLVERNLGSGNDPRNDGGIRGGILFTTF
jgi:hypothetical protein